MRESFRKGNEMEGNEMGLSRRNFLRGAGLAAIGAAAATSLGGCASSDSSADWMPSKWDFETDVLVIGYGGAGLWAAVTAKDEGNSDVLVLEKAPSRGGGNSSINMGEYTWIDDVDEAVKYITGFSKGHTPEEIARAWAEECYNNMDYCDRWGVKTEKKKGTNATGGTASCEYPWIDGAKAMHVCSFGDPTKGGNDGWHTLDQARADLGIEVKFSCHDETLIQNPETKEIVGAYTYIGDDGTQYAIKARKGVIMTIGGFEHNDELKNTYCKCYPMNGFYGWPFNTGDGIKMVQDVGAQLWHMNNIIGSLNAWFKDFEWKYAFTLVPQANNYVMLDRLGNRWIAESTFLSPHVGWHELEKFNDEKLCDFERIPTWVILDQNVIDAGPLGPAAGGAVNSPGGSTTLGMTLSDIPAECGQFPGWSEDNSAEIQKGWILKADTIDELIEKMAEVDEAPDAEAVKATIEKYNGYCAAGSDPDFQRTEATLAPVATPPYYAYPLYPGGCSTLGGPKKDVNAQVLDVDDKPIGRLYAAGCFGNMASHTYGISGGNNAENMVWGRIAARSASANKPWDEK